MGVLLESHKHAHNMSEVMYLILNAGVVSNVVKVHKVSSRVGMAATTLVPFIIHVQARNARHKGRRMHCRNMAVLY